MMTREEVYARLHEVFSDVFDREDITLNDGTVAADVEGWDSLAHISLISAVEDAFEVDFPMRAVVRLENVGQLVDMILEELGA